MHIQFTSKPVDKLACECVVVTCFRDERPLRGAAALLDWRLNGRLSRLILKNRFQGQFKETLLLPSEGRIKSPSILVMGLGPRMSFGESQCSNFVQHVVEIMGKRQVTDFMISLAELTAQQFEWRNMVRLLVSQLHHYPNIKMVRLNESDEYVRDAKKRQMDFGFNFDVSFETNAA